MEINLANCKTSAQVVTKICYNEATRNLNFRIRCKDLEDFKACVKIIEGYNDFAWDRVHNALDKFLANKDSHEERDIFQFEIAREGSVAMYVNDTWRMSGKIGQEKFEKKLRAFAKETKADECHFNFPTKGDAYDFTGDPDPMKLECRLWWD